MTTTFYVTRDTSDPRASDETCAMAHVHIGRTGDLADAHHLLRQSLLKEAKYLVDGRDITVPGDVWAFKRAAALVELVADVEGMNPFDAPGHRISREVDGLRFTIAAVTR